MDLETCQRGSVLGNHSVVSSTGGKKPRFFYGYIVVLAAFFIFVIMNGTMYSFGVFLKPLTADFGWTRAVTSGAYSLFLLMSGFLYIVTGRLNDRFGPRIVLTVCGIFLGVGYLLMFFLGAIWQLYLFYGVIIAVGHSGGLGPLPSTVARWFVRRRGMMTGITVSGIGAGTIIMPPIASQLITNYGWRVSFLIIGVIALVTATLAAQFLKRDPSLKGQFPDGDSEAKEDNVASESGGFSLQEAIRARRFWMLTAVYFCFGYGLLTIMGHIVPHATDLGISSVIAANIIATIGGVSIVGRIGIGSASDRIGNKPSLIISFILLSIAFFWLLVAKEIWMLYLFAVVLGFAYGALIAILSPTVAELFGLRAHGAIMGTIIFLHSTGCALGAFIAGLVFDITGSYYLAFLVCAILSVIALIMVSLLKITDGGEITRKTRPW